MLGERERRCNFGRAVLRQRDNKRGLSENFDMIDNQNQQYSLFSRTRFARHCAACDCVDNVARRIQLIGSATMRCCCFLCRLCPARARQRSALDCFLVLVAMPPSKTISPRNRILRNRFFKVARRAYHSNTKEIVTKVQKKKKEIIRTQKKKRQKFKRRKKKSFSKTSIKQNRTTQHITRTSQLGHDRVSLVVGVLLVSAAAADVFAVGARANRLAALSAQIAYARRQRALSRRSLHSAIAGRRRRGIRTGRQRTGRHSVWFSARWYRCSNRLKDMIL